MKGDGFQRLMKKLELIETFPEEEKERAYKILNNSSELLESVLKLLFALEKKDVVESSKSVTTILKLLVEKY